MNNKDWTGNCKSMFTTLGASNHSEHEREAHDYYATEPYAVELLLQEETFNHEIWEPACGEGHISNVLIAHGYDVKSSDIIDRGYGDVQDFLVAQYSLFDDNVQWNGDIITNPPYKYATEFVEQALSIIPVGNKVAMFLKIQFLESQSRMKLFENNPPKTVYVSVKRLRCAMNGDFEKYKGSNAMCYAWFVWEKGFKGEPVIKWINK